MVWGFGVCMFRCKWEWEWECVLGRWEWEVRDNSVFLGLCTSHVSNSGWIKKTWYSSSRSSSTRKSGRFLYCLETVFLDKLFPKLMVMGHFARITPFNSAQMGRFCLKESYSLELCLNSTHNLWQIFINISLNIFFLVVNFDNFPIRLHFLRIFFILAKFLKN